MLNGEGKKLAVNGERYVQPVEGECRRTAPAGELRGIRRSSTRMRGMAENRYARPCCKRRRESGRYGGPSLWRWRGMPREARVAFARDEMEAGAAAFENN